MTDREKLISLAKEGDCSSLTYGECSRCKYGCKGDCSYQFLADHILANGVVVREKGEWESCVIYTGNWINTCTYGSEGWACSVCGEGVLEKHNFCPNCGADMRKGENG